MLQALHQLLPAREANRYLNMDLAKSDEQPSYHLPLHLHRDRSLQSDFL